MWFNINKPPRKFTIICQKTNRIIETTNTPPLTCDLETYEPFEGSDTVFIRTQTKVAYVDVRFDARMRLWNYIRRKNGMETYPPKRKAIWHDPQAGNTIGILEGF